MLAAAGCKGRIGVIRAERELGRISLRVCPGTRIYKKMNENWDVIMQLVSNLELFDSYYFCSLKLH